MQWRSFLICTALSRPELGRNMASFEAVRPESLQTLRLKSLELSLFSRYIPAYPK